MEWLRASVLQPIQGLASMSKRQVGFQLLSFLLIVSSALVIWKGLALATNSESPIVVVLSASMEPGLKRGDLLFLSMYDDPINIGDICVFKIRGREVPIVHRVVRLLEPDATGKQLILTKGDNNNVDDRTLYNPGQVWIERSDIIGRARAVVPYAGMLTILMNDYPYFKVLLLGGLALFVIITRE